MNTYHITIKDNSIPSHLLQPNAITEYTGTIQLDKVYHTTTERNEFTMENYNISVIDSSITDYLENLALELDTDPESLEILSIIKQ